MAIHDPLSGLTQQLLDSAPDAVVIIGEDGRIRFANIQVERLFGYGRTELLGKEVEVLVPDRVKPVHPDHRARYFANPTMRPMGAGLDLTARRKDGSEFPADIALSSVETAEGILVSAAIRDATERKQAETINATLAAIIESSLDAIIGKTIGGVIISWNKAADQLFGWSSDEAIGRKVDLLIPPEHRVQEDELMTRTANGEKVEPYETERLTKDGRRLSIALSSSPIRQSDGEIVGVASICRDVTHAKRTEQKFRGLLEAFPDAVVGVDQRGYIRLLNAQAERLFGYQRDELIGEPIEVLVPDRVRPVHPDHRAEYFANPVTRPMGAGLHLTALRKDGTEIPVDIALSSLETEDGLIVSAAVRDISERIRAAKETERLEAQLERSRLESIGQLAGGIAHDFNNLLGGIMAYANLVREQLVSPQDDADTDSAIDDIDQIIRATERAAGLTRQLLLFGRKDVAQSEILDLNAIVADMEGMLQRTIGEQIHLTTSLAPSLGSIRTNEGHVEQTVMNLVVNARDAMPSGGNLSVRTSPAVLDEDYATRNGIKPGQYVCLSVSDTGTGMPKDVMTRVFEPYFSTKAQGEGSGLGLATVYGIVSGVGGHIGIYSEVGLGTTIKVYFPLVDAVAIDSAPRGAAAGGPVLGETILLVEDEAMVRDPAARFLGRAGYTLLVAEHPEQALSIASDHDGAIDLLLTDVVMPGMSGKELAEKLLIARPGTLVIYMSGYSRDVITHHGAVDREVTLIEKPFTAQELLSTVREALDHDDRRR